MFRQLTWTSGFLVLIFACTVFGGENNNQARPQNPAPAADNGDKGDKGGKTPEPTRSLPEEILSVESMQLENGFRRLMNERAGLENQRLQTGNRWVEMELGAFKRLVADQAKDLKSIRDQQARIEKQRRQILSVINGQNSMSGQTALVKAMLQAAPSNDLTNLLGTRVSTIPSEHFVAESGSVIATTLKRDGRLAAPPRILVGLTAADGIGRDAFEFQSEWGNALEQMRYGNQLSADQAERLEVTFTKWNASAQRVLEECPRLERVQAKQYLLQVSGLVAKVKSPERADEVVFWISGTGFSGGSLGDLVQFMASHRLTLRFGSEPHLALQQVGIQWVKELDKSIACLEVGRVKAIAANPAHQAALKSLIAQQPINGSASGKELASKGH